MAIGAQVRLDGSTTAVHKSWPQALEDGIVIIDHPCLQHDDTRRYTAASYWRRLHQPLGLDATLPANARFEVPVLE